MQADLDGKFRDKKLLILGGAGPHCKVVEAAREMGVYTIVTDCLPKESAPAKLLADEHWEIDILDIDTLYACAQMNQVNGVLGFCLDPAQKPAQQLAERLGVPTFGGNEQLDIFTNKRKFKNFCMDHGVDVIPEYRKEAVAKGNLSYPILVKPVDSRGSRGSAVCWNKEEALIAISYAEKLSSDGDVIIEQYVQNCQDLTISYIVKDGYPYLISVGDRYPGREEDNLNRQLACTIQPSRYAVEYYDRVHGRVAEMIKQSGVKNGPVFMQGYMDGDTVRMYDPGIRFPGNEYERIYLQTTGLNPMKSIIAYVLGGEIEDYEGNLEGSYMLNGYCAIQYMINVGPGIIGKIEGLDLIKEYPAVLDIQQRHYVGDVIADTGDIRHRAGEISVMVKRDLMEMKKAVDHINKSLTIEDIYGKSMLISCFTSKDIERYYGGWL